jgi:biofilm protein TabA
MIFDTLENMHLYAGLIPARLYQGLQFLRDTDLTTLAIGRHDIDADNLYALVQEYTTRPFEQGKWEAHRKYIDIQHMVSGIERMGFANLAFMQLGEYFPDRDFQSLSGLGSSVDVLPGAFTIFFPQDAHMPGLCVDQPVPIRKVVLKISVA